MESGSVELVNHFRPQFPDDSGGIGYKAYGVYQFSSPEILRDGFRIRLEWPPVDDTHYHIGGNKDRAVLAIILGPEETSETTLELVHAQDILMNPQAYDGRRIQLEGEFHGWEGGLTDCPSPVTRSDWLAGDGGAYLYVHGPFPDGLTPQSEENSGTRIVVIGTVQLQIDPTCGTCPFIEAEESRLAEEEPITEGPSGGCLATLPVYPGAVLTAALEGLVGQLVQSMGATSLEGSEGAVYTCSADPGSVVKFYELAMADAGWERVLYLTSEGGFIITWSRGDLSAQLVVATEEGNTFIIIGCGKEL
jgi:hypothetical protein